MLSQKFFYPLYHTFEQKLFVKLLGAVKKNYKFIGSDEEKIFFVKTLFYYQLINKDYRKHLHIIYRNLSPKTNIGKINELTRKIEFEKDLSWITWLFEKDMVKLVNKFWCRKKIKFVGNDAQFNEFILRYLVSIWLVGWAGPLYALLIATRDEEMDFKECNKILSLWDFTGVFKNYKCQMLNDK